MRVARPIVSIGLLIGLLGHSGGAFAQADMGCPADEGPTFVGAFATLKAYLADWQGDPTTCEFADPKGTGDRLQRTTTGMAIWRSSTGRASFTNGVDHWALSAGGVLYWNGSSIDPPDDAQPAVPNPCLARGTCAPPLLARPAPTPTRAPTSLPAVSSAVPAYASSTRWMCLEANPSCARDVWWREHNELQDDAPVVFQAIGARFTSERRFVEAVNLLWQWPAGADLLRQAEDGAVQVMTLSIEDDREFASYAHQRRVVAFNRPYVTAPTWLLADVLAHELQHHADAAAGRSDSASRSDCLARETSAFQTERAFLVWLTRTLEPEGLPPLAALQTQLAPEHAALVEVAYERGFSPDLPRLVDRTYEGYC